MSMEVRPYGSELEASVMNLSHLAWIFFKYNKDNAHQKMSCLFNENENLIAVGYLRHGIADDHDVMEIVMKLNEEAASRIDEVRIALYPSLIDIYQAIRNPEKPTKLVAWDDFKGDRSFYIEQGFYSYQNYNIGKRSLEESLPEVIMPQGVKVHHHPLKTKDERDQYTEIENQYYQGVVYRSTNMLEWMMGGPELYTISAFEDNELVGSVMCWQDGAVARLFTIPRWRNQGLGELLLTQAFKYHLNKGRTNVETLVNEQDQSNIHLLESMGYYFPIKLELLALDL